jgi:hypothetical protein
MQDKVQTAVYSVFFTTHRLPSGGEEKQNEKRDGDQLRRCNQKNRQQSNAVSFI